MYAPSTTSTTSGSGGRVVRAPGGGERRVRVVRLLRPRRSTPAFGFSMRGGCEHGTGFFISKVEFNSEAYHQGLKVGDQVVSVNGYRVEDAVHLELSHYLATQTRLKMKIRNVGMLPIKEKAHDPLSWQFVSERASLGSGVSSSPTLCHTTDRLADMHLSLLVPPRAKLGCGICKGPEWKPGIFVQFVREGGIAREAGLRPGDQILACNGKEFTKTIFNDAIQAMKATGRLELTVRPGAGLELVSPESSGYNSSASSAAGERSPAAGPPAAPAPPAPPAALRRRLASVAEEAADRADRLKRRTWDSLDWKNIDIHNFDAPSDIEPDYDSPSIPNNPHSYENRKKNVQKKDSITGPSNRTIINLTENGATIQCSYDNKQSNKKYSSNQYEGGRDNDKKTIVVEVHHTSCTLSAHAKSSGVQELQQISSDSSSISSSTTLSSAIAEEIQRRKLNKKNATETNKQDVKKSNVPKTVDSEKKKQHDALMDEFKKVHQKMFAHQETKQAEDDAAINGNEEQNPDRQSTLPLRSTSTPPRVVNGTVPRENGGSTDKPPPPPPMPLTNGNSNGNIQHLTNGRSHQNTNSLSSGLKQIDLSKDIFPQNGTLKRMPTPDYKNDSQAKVVNHRSKDETVELDSLESYKLKSPQSGQPKPPATYFSKAPNGPPTMKKHARPVSVTIGEYPGGGRKHPSKLDFLGEKQPIGGSVTDGAPLSNRLHSELALTLSRSNLRKKTESLERNISKNSIKQDINKHNDSDDSLDKNFHVRYGNNILPMPPAIAIPKASALKHSLNQKMPHVHEGLKNEGISCSAAGPNHEKKINFNKLIMSGDM